MVGGGGGGGGGSKDQISNVGGNIRGKRGDDVIILSFLCSDSPSSKLGFDLTTYQGLKAKREVILKKSH